MPSPQNSTPAQADYRKIRKQLLRKNVEETLLRFKFTNLTSDTIFNLFEVEPAEVNHKLLELKLPNNKQSVAQLLSSRSRAFSVEELEDVLYSLVLYRTAFCSKMQTWTPINLLEPADDLQCHEDVKIISLNIRQAFRIKGLNAIVKIISHDDMVWIMIIEKKLTRKRGVKLQTPVFFCYEVGTPYIFVASKVKQTVIECILKAMQYKKHKMQQLEGKDVKSLLSILKNKAINRGANRLVKYQPAEAEIGHRNIDFTKKKARLSYANHLFHTQDPISLETFLVNAESVWRDKNLVPEMSGETLETSLLLKSTNLIEMIKYMVVNEMVATPLPEYVHTILRSGKNKIVMCAPKR